MRVPLTVERALSFYQVVGNVNGRGMRVKKGGKNYNVRRVSGLLERTAGAGLGVKKG